MPISPATLSGLSQVRHGRGLVSLVQICLAGLFHATTTYAVPFLHPATLHLQEETAEPKPASGPSLYAYLGTAIALVLLGGAFAGLTIALMGQDEVYLQVIETSGEGSEKKNAAKVLRLLKRGKHWVLVTLLVGNVITNETLPLVLDRSLGGGYAAAISSTVLVIIFGEIVPQSLCVRFGLPIGAVMSPFVLVLMYIFAPITWPIAKLLDWLLGEDHGTTYKKAGLKTLVDLHKTIGTTPGDRLNEDEVAIISGVLDLKAKAVGSIMTPMDDVFTLSAEAVLDEDMIEDIMREGYSRIPIHDPNNRGDFVGMLLVKMLITYDPEDARRVNEFALATLPETRPDTSCLDIINFFQEGKSHMVLVSDFPGQSYGALGVVTLEDVIEELIGEEIIDESDVFVDIHKALRRPAPAPTHRHARALKGQIVPDNNSQAVGDESQLSHHHISENGEAERATSTKRGSTASIDRKKTLLMRRSSVQSADGKGEIRQVQLNSKDADLKQSLRSLGPSNVASRPRQTRINTVISKPGVATIPENKDAAKQLQMSAVTDSERPITTPDPTDAQKGIGEDLLIAPGNDASDGIQALHTEYGTLDRTGPSNDDSQSRSESNVVHNTSHGGLIEYSSEARPNKMVLQRSGSHSTLGSLHSQSSGELPRKRRHTARSGSITENIIESGGRKKMVLEPSSSSDDENGASLQQSQSSKNRSRGPSHQGRSKDHAQANGHVQDSERGQDGSKEDESGKVKAKKRRPHRHRKKKEGSKGDENTPLLSRD